MAEEQSASMPGDAFPSASAESKCSMQSDGSKALPHLSVPNISHVDWRALKQAGFEGCVFDKDNTLTEPYAIAIAPILVASLKTCLETFEGRVVLLSNSAGLQEFDPDGMPFCPARILLTPAFCTEHLCLSSSL